MPSKDASILTVTIRVYISFWDALKLRLAGKQTREHFEAMLQRAVELARAAER